MKRPMLAVTVLLVLVGAAPSASAQGFINPFVGTTLTSPSTRGSSSQAGFGVALGSVGSIIGAETEIAYYPHVLDNAANGLAKNKVITFSGGLLVGPTIGPLKVYGAAGLGDLYLNVTSLSSIVVPNPASISNNYFTVNVGGGVMGFVAPHFGLRGDLRYYRAYGFQLSDLQSTGLALTRFDFWRADVGIVAKF
jgi:hypothetical protein